MDRPRVVLFAPIYPPAKGGSATYFSNMVDLMKDRVDFTVVCLKMEGYPERDWSNGVLVLRLLPDEYDSHPFKRYLKVLPAAFMILGSLKKSGPFILHAHSNGIYGLSASLFSSVRKVPMIKEVQDTSDPGWNLRVGNVIYWVSCGRHVAGMLRKNKVPDGKIRTFTIINPPGMDSIVEERKNSVRRPDDRIRMIYVGWLLNRVKGVDVLLEAFRRAHSRRSDLELVIVGDGPDREELETKAEGLPVTFTGELEYSSVIERYLSSHFTVMASHEEAAGRIYTEGYAAGIPAIGTDVGGTPEVLIDGRTGILVEDGDVEGFARAILKMAEDKDMRERLARGGKELLEEIGDWEGVREWYLETYTEIWKDTVTE